MAENSKIEWTTHTSLTWRPKLKSKLMNGNMARLAQGHTIPCFSAQFREFSKWPDVVGLKVSTAIISAHHAAEFVTQFNVICPLLDFLCQAKSTALVASPVNVSGRILTAMCNEANRVADLGANLDGQNRSLRWALLAFASIGHARLCRIGMRLSQKGGRPSFGANSFRHSPARDALGGLSIIARSVFGKPINRLPLAAFGAFFQTGLSQLLKFGKANSGFLGRNFQRTFGSLSHG